MLYELDDPLGPTRPDLVRALAIAGQIRNRRRRVAYMSVAAATVLCATVVAMSSSLDGHAALPEAFGTPGPNAVTRPPAASLAPGRPHVAQAPPPLVLAAAPEHSGPGADRPPVAGPPRLPFLSYPHRFARRVPAIAAYRPCEDDGTSCRPLLATAACETTGIVAGDPGDLWSLRLSVARDLAVARTGEPLAMTATISNVGRASVSLDVYTDIDGGLLTGRALNGGGRQRPLDVRGGRRQQATEITHLRIPPNGRRTVPVTILTRGCRDDEVGPALPAGRYDVHAGIYVAGFGWWAAPATTVLLTP